MAAFMLLDTTDCAVSPLSDVQEERLMHGGFYN